MEESSRGGIPQKNFFGIGKKRLKKMQNLPGVGLGKGFISHSSTLEMKRPTWLNGVIPDWFRREGASVEGVGLSGSRRTITLTFLLNPGKIAELDSWVEV